jgi:DNA repair protein RadC
MRMASDVDAEVTPNPQAVRLAPAAAYAVPPEVSARTMALLKALQGDVPEPAVKPAAQPVLETQALRAAPKAPKEKPHYAGHRARLRERFLQGGAVAVADYELLEMLLFAAHARGDVKPLAKQLITRFGSFKKVLQAEMRELAMVDGLGEAGVAAIKVVEASAQRMLKEEAREKTVIQSWTALLDYCRLGMAHKVSEEFRVLFLNHKNALVADEVQSRGTINHATVYPREVVKRALEMGAAALILVHNHPTGDVTPSKADIDITKEIVAAAKPLGIQIHDHLIVGGDKHFSFKGHGLL